MQENASKKSIKVNMILNAIKGLMSIIFPIISFPYVSNALGVNGLGQYDFANSIISYFVMFAGLGISTYATREGARIRNKEEEFRRLANQLFSINIYSTLMAYVLFAILLLVVPKFAEYKILLIILSLQIVFKTIGVEWIYVIFEDFKYITVRSIFFQLISLLLLFTLVKGKEDLYLYASITVLSSVGSNVLNYIHARKYCNVKMTREINLSRHIRPVMVLFASTVTVTIYVSSDTTMLGFICGDYTVGIYSVSVRIYNIVKTILSSVLVVSIPRISFILGENNKEKFSAVASEIYFSLISLALPALTGVIALRKDIILLISGREYIEATSSLLILSLALFACLGAWFWSQCILIPLKKDGDLLIATILSAVANVGLNFILIPFFREKAAAFTTFIAEAITMLWCWKKGHYFVRFKGTEIIIMKSFFGCMLIIAIKYVTYHSISNALIRLLTTVIISVIIYFLFELLVKNRAIEDFINSCIRKVKSIIREKNL